MPERVITVQRFPHVQVWVWLSISAILKWELLITTRNNMVSVGLISSIFLLVLKLSALAGFGRARTAEWISRDLLIKLIKAAFIVSAILVYIAGNSSNQNRGSVPQIAGKQCEKADADLIGDGAFYGLFLQELLLALIAFVGTLHKFPNAMKEVGAGLIVTHESLVFALFIPLYQGKLSMVDAILGAMILDSQNVALSIQLVAKDTLTSGNQVRMVLITQFIGLVFIAYTVDSFSKGKLETKDCSCFTVFWWAWISNCPDKLPKETPRHIVPFWIYIAFRFIGYFQLFFISIGKARVLKRAEKAEREEEESEGTQHQICDSCNNCLGYNRKKQTCQFPCASRCGSCHRCVKCGKLSEPETQYSEVPAEHPAEHRICNACNNCRGLYHRKLICRSSCTNKCSSCKRCRECGTSTGYSASPATTSFLCAESVALAILSFQGLWSATSEDYKIKSDSGITSIGQVTAFVIAFATIARSAYVFLRGAWPTIKAEYLLRTSRQLTSYGV